jgi:hypothetical protein
MQHRPTALWLALLIILAEITYLAFYAVAPLRGLGFADAHLAERWPLLLAPTRWLFPKLGLVVPTPGPSAAMPSLPLSWLETCFLALTLAMPFVPYLLALRLIWRRPESAQRWGLALVLGGTLLCSITLLLSPVLQSTDVFAYIAYARLYVVHHVNPLVMPPIQFPHDPAVQAMMYWMEVPSVYGPSWIWLSSAVIVAVHALLQGGADIAEDVLAFRALGLLCVLLTTGIIWMTLGISAPKKRLLGSLLYAWNPLVLIEFVANAHNDAAVALLVAAAFWALLARRTVVMLALLSLATCLKFNVAVLLPFVAVFYLQRNTLPRIRPFRLWTAQQVHRVSVAGAALLGMIVACYLPFWDGGQALLALKQTPSASRVINSFASLGYHLYDAWVTTFGDPGFPERRAWSVEAVQAFDSVRFDPFQAQLWFHNLSLGLFAFFCLALFALAVWGRQRIRTPGSLAAYWSQAWLAFCLIGAPWFWPWYAGVSVGITALHPSRRAVLLVVALSLGALEVYIFWTYAPAHLLPISG